MFLLCFQFRWFRIKMLLFILTFLGFRDGPNRSLQFVIQNHLPLICLPARKSIIEISFSVCLSVHFSVFSSFFSYIQHASSTKGSSFGKIKSHDVFHHFFNDLLGLVVNLFRCDVAIETHHILYSGMVCIWMDFVISVSRERVSKYAIILCHHPPDDESYNKNENTNRRFRFGWWANWSHHQSTNHQSPNIFRYLHQNITRRIMQ